MIFNFTGHLSLFTKRTRQEFIETFKNFLLHTDRIVKEEYELNGMCIIKGNRSSLVINANTDKIVMRCETTPQAAQRAQSYGGLTFNEMLKIYYECVGRWPVKYLSDEFRTIILDVQNHGEAFMNSITDTTTQFKIWVKDHPTDFIDTILRRLIGNLDINGYVPIEDLWAVRASKFNRPIAECLDAFKECHPAIDIKPFLESSYAVGVERFLNNHDNKIRNWIKIITNNYRFKNSLAGLMDKEFNSNMHQLAEEALVSDDRHTFVLANLPDHIHPDFAKAYEIAINHRKDLALHSEGLGDDHGDDD